MHKLLKLQHHQHSGKLLPHHHTSYRALGLLLGLLGFALLGLHQGVSAEQTLFVKAKISAPYPTMPAVISTPQSGFISKESVVVLTGVCQTATPANVVVVSDNDNPVGSVPCQDNGTFRIAVTLTEGAHTLLAQIYNFTEDAGPASTPIQVMYTPPLPPQPAPTIFTARPATPTTPTATPLEIRSSKPAYSFGPHSPVVWVGSILGGQAPYAVSIDWGDQTSSAYTVHDATEKSFRHNYDTMEAFTITITVRDAVGGTATKSFAATTAYKPSTTSTETPSGIQFSFPSLWEDKNMLRIYSAYALTAVVVGLIWFDARHIRPFHLATQRAGPRTRTPAKKTAGHKRTSTPSTKSRRLAASKKRQKHP